MAHHPLETVNVYAFFFFSVDPSKNSWNISVWIIVVAWLTDHSTVWAASVALEPCPRIKIKQLLQLLSWWKTGEKDTWDEARRCLRVLTDTCLIKTTALSGDLLSPFDLNCDSIYQGLWFYMVTHVLVLPEAGVQMTKRGSQSVKKRAQGARLTFWRV